MDAGVLALLQVYTQWLRAQPQQLLWVSTSYRASLFACTEAVYLSSHMHAQCAELVCRYLSVHAFMHDALQHVCSLPLTSCLYGWGLLAGLCVAAYALSSCVGKVPFSTCFHAWGVTACVQLVFNFMLVCVWMRSVSKSFCLKSSPSHLTIKICDCIVRWFLFSTCIAHTHTHMCNTWTYTNTRLTHFLTYVICMLRGDMCVNEHNFLCC